MASSGFDLDEAMALAIRHHGASRSDAAEAIYRRILLAQPNHANALNGLAVLLWQAGRLAEGQAFAALATRIAPEIWRYHYTDGLIACGMRRFEHAVTAFERTCNLHPGFADAWIGLARALYGAARFAEAAQAYSQVRSLQPLTAETLNDYGVSLHAASRFGEAMTVFRQGLAQRADMASLHTNLGNTLSKLDLHEEARAASRKAVDLAPTEAEYSFNYGNVLASQSELQEACTAFRAVLQIDPRHVRAWVNLGNAQRSLGNAQASLESYAHAIEIDPSHHDAHNNLGVTFLALGKIDEAIEAIQRALTLDSQSSVAHNNLGNAFKAAGRMDEAIDAYRQATQLQPTDSQPHSNLLYSLYFHPAYEETAILHEARRWARLHAMPLWPPATARLNDNADKKDSTAERVLRIGYVSPDFREHCQSLFTLPLLANHDHARFSIHCYAHLSAPDAVTARLRAHADVWRPIKGLSDAQVAGLIAHDGIDILVDLTMHMADGRPLVFARKPAPIQFAWLAYPGTTGQPAIDYRLTDPWLDPLEFDDRRYVERSIRLPHTFWCYDPGDAPTVGAPPMRTAGHITFGCLNNLCKVSDISIELWSQILACVPHSRLVLLASPGKHRARMAEKFRAAAIAPERIEFVPFQARAHYLATYARIDICLDTLPYNGHTTSLDAYWMGVPVVTRVGQTVVGRAGWSQLNNLALQDLAAFDDAEFVDKAITLAANPGRLETLRGTLRDRMRASPLMDGKAFAAAMEGIYRRAWHMHAAPAAAASDSALWARDDLCSHIP